MTPWTDVAARNAVDADNPLSVSVGEHKIGVYEIDGQLHAIEDVCPHAYALLSQGFVDGCEIECPLHNAVFDIRTGQHRRGEPCRDVRTFAVQVRDDRIEVQA
jgi:3-phenylpropionate/trans-cinnamate dioxygenase ferredoxin component